MSFQQSSHCWLCEVQNKMPIACSFKHKNKFKKKIMKITNLEIHIYIMNAKSNMSTIEEKNVKQERDSEFSKEPDKVCRTTSLSKCLEWCWSPLPFQILKLSPLINLTIKLLRYNVLVSLSVDTQKRTAWHEAYLVSSRGTFWCRLKGGQETQP